MDAWDHHDSRLFYNPVSELAEDPGLGKSVDIASLIQHIRKYYGITRNRLSNQR